MNITPNRERFDRLKLAAENYRLWRDEILAKPEPSCSDQARLEILRAQVADLVVEVLPGIDPEPPPRLLVSVRGARVVTKRAHSHLTAIDALSKPWKPWGMARG